MSAHLSRRGLLRAGGLVAGASVLGALPGSPAAASVSETLKFNLGSDSTELFREEPLADPTVMQSFAFDNVNKRIYFAQKTAGGGNGDLTITKTDYSGHLVGPGHVYLSGFGHGNQIAVQPYGGGAYVWVEAVADSGGLGTKLARFYFNHFSSGQTLSSTTSGVEIYDPWNQYDGKTIAIDPYWNRVCMRYYIGAGVHRHSLYDLSRFEAHDYSQLLATIDVNYEPSDFQGFATFGSYLYLLNGTAYNDPFGDPLDGIVDSSGNRADGNTVIRAVNWNTGAGANNLSLTRAGKTLYYREPEGMAIQMPDLTDPSQARLCFGFASGFSGDRQASIYYKTGMV